MLRRTFSRGCGRRRVTLALSGAALAQETVKIGLILPMTGPFASTGRQIEAAAKLYMQQKGDTVAGKKIQLIVKDDTGVAGRDQAPGAGADRQRQGHRAGRLRPDAARARHRAACDPGARCRRS